VTAIRSPYLTKREAALVIHRSEKTVQRLVDERRIPVRQPAGTRGLLFVESELAAWIDGAALEVVADSPARGLVVRPKGRAGR
jgi:excisionase family DNA binding protein